MAQMFGKHAYELLQEVASCPAESLPPFNVSRRSALQRRSREATCTLTQPPCSVPLPQEELFRNVLDEVTLQHERLTTVFK